MHVDGNVLTLVSGPMVVWLRDWPKDRKVAGLISKSTDFLSNNYGEATNAHVSLLTNQHELVPAGYIAGWSMGMNALQSCAGKHLVAKRLYAILKYV